MHSVFAECVWELYTCRQGIKYTKTDQKNEKPVR